jgi:perosamine synthetase
METSMGDQIPIARPLMGLEEAKIVEEVLQSGVLAQGEYVKEFEESFSDYIGVQNSVAVSSGTVALDLALKALGIQHGDEVITPSFTFIATANSILFQGAKPIFADIDETTFTINPNDVLDKVTAKSKAVIGVHLFGHPFDVKAVREICEDHHLVLIEDSAQAHGAEYEGKKVGGFGIGCFSFYPTKNMTTGEGGMITTTSDTIAETCRLLRNHGESEKYRHIILGYNYRMTNIQAALGIIQLKKLDGFNEKRIQNAEYLTKHIKKPGLKKPFKKDEVKHVYHQYAVLIEDEFPISRDEFMRYLKNNDIGCAIHYPLPIHKQPLYQRLGYTDENVQCPVATSVADKILSLPVHPALQEKDLRYIAETINTLKGKGE